MRFHLDTDFLVTALSRSGPERTRLMELAASEAEIQISAIAWYEFCDTSTQCPSPRMMGDKTTDLAVNPAVTFCE